MSATGSLELKSYPLTPAQQLPLFARTYTVHKQVVNIPISMLIDGDIDPVLLKQAIELAIERNDAFGIRLIHEDKTWKQYFTTREVICLEKLDFTGKTDVEMDAEFHRIGRIPLKLEQSPMVKIYLFQSPAGRWGVFAVVNHLVMDSWSIGVFFKDIMGVYYALRDGTPMPKALRSYETILQRDLEYLTSDRYKADVEYWSAVVATETAECYYTSINGSDKLDKQRQKAKDPTARFAGSFYLTTTARHEVLMMDAPLVERMKTYCVEHNYPISLLVFMGIRLFYSRVNRRAKVIGSMNMVSRRSTLEEKSSGGTRVQTILMGTALDENLSFKAALERILADQNEHYRHADLSPMKVLDLEREQHGMKQGTNWRALSYTFQPMALELEHGDKIVTKWYCNGSAAQPLYITVMDGDGTGALRFYYEYLDKHIQVENIRACHAFAIRVIEAGINDPTITVGELIDLTD